MSKDGMRTDLITRFFCTECGGKLTLSYGEDGASSTGWQVGDPTGAAVRYNSIMVHPCRRCIEKHTAPAKALAKAIADMEKAND